MISLICLGCTHDHTKVSEEVQLCETWLPVATRLSCKPDTRRGALGDQSTRRTLRHDSCLALPHADHPLWVRPEPAAHRSTHTHAHAYATAIPHERSGAATFTSRGVLAPPNTLPTLDALNVRRPAPSSNALAMYGICCVILPGTIPTPVIGLGAPTSHHPVPPPQSCSSPGHPAASARGSMPEMVRSLPLDSFQQPHDAPPCPYCLAIGGSSHHSVARDE